MTSDERTPRIVAGVHNTAASDAALDWATREARLRRARLHLILARDTDTACCAPYAHPGTLTADDADVVWLASVAIRAARVLPAGWVTTELADGLPAAILADRAAGASLLVLGAAPTEFLGPAARACLRRAPCPVVIVAPDSRRAAGSPRSRRPAEAQLQPLRRSAGQNRRDRGDRGVGGDHGQRRSAAAAQAAAQRCRQLGASGHGDGGQHDGSTMKACPRPVLPCPRWSGCWPTRCGGG
jgi:nucleotide-binding universal stress UspA family protein